MHRKIKISIAMIATLMMAVFAIDLVMAATSIGKVSVASVPAATANVKTIVDDGLQITPEQAADPEQLKKLVPATYAEAERNILPIRTRFLMWTNDGVHVMWGVFRKGYFTGTDNLGKTCWGIYGRGVFAGFYDGKFFWGKYSLGTWKAQYLFGLNNSYGKYLTFPPIATAIAYPTSIVP